jgi:AraC-like DNA-binding protein
VAAFHVTRQFLDPDEVASAIPAARLELAVLGPPSGAWSISQLELEGEHRLLVARMASPFSGFGAIEEWATHTVWPMSEDTAGWTVNGRPIHGDTLLQLGRGAEYAVIARQPLQWAALVSPSHAGKPGAPAPAVFLTPSRDGEAMRRLRELTRVALRLARSNEPDAARIALASMLRTLDPLMETGNDRPVERTKPNLHTLVQLLRTRGPEAVHAGDLARMAGWNERALRRDFASHFGISVGRYLRIRRLNDVRRELANPENKIQSVTQAAIKHGFYDLGRFAAAYRRTFGENPSATLSRTRRAARLTRLRDPLH